MSLLNSLQDQCVFLNGEAKNKNEVLEEIASLLSGSSELSEYSQDELKKALSDREALGSTAFGGGIAIPHASLEKASGFVVGVYICPKGVEFDAIDGEPVKLFFFLVGPKTERNTHILFLSTISKILQQENAKQELLNAKYSDDIRKTISRFSTETEKKEAVEKCIFHIFIQREEFFDEILQIFSSTPGSSVSVVESYNAGKYLHRLPLFASLWSQDQSMFNRLIIAVADKSKCNDIIRRINLISDDINSKSGVLIAVNDLLYAGGWIDF